MINLYWPVYKNLERELSSLSEVIHFDDYQLGVYSIKIYDLLVRTVIEIEAISKEMYYSNGGTVLYDENGKERPPFFDTECLNYLERLWKLSKKQVMVTAATFYFEKTENRVLTPLHKANCRGGADWNKAYQMVKHNRTEDITALKKGKKPKGTLKKLIRAMAALFILNIYYKDENIYLGENSSPSSVSIGSDLFSVKTMSHSLTERENKEKYAMSLFSEVETAVFMVKRKENSIVQKYYQVLDEYNKALNIKIKELSRCDMTKEEINDIWGRALKIVPNSELISSLNIMEKNKEYEAVTVKPDRVVFYKSSTCISTYTDEQLIQIEENIRLWKNDSKIYKKLDEDMRSCVSNN